MNSPCFNVRFLGRTLEFQLEFIAMMAIAAFWAVRLDAPVRSLEGCEGQQYRITCSSSLAICA